MHYENPIPKLQHIVCEIDNIISSQKMQIGDQKEWQRRIENLQEILQEHNEWISEATDKAVKRRDEQWQYLVDEEYVKKDVVEELKKRITEMETTAINLRNENEAKDNLVTKNQQDISWINATNEREKDTLNNRIRNLLWQKVGLEEKIGDLHDYIGNFLDDAGRRERENLRHQEEDLIVRKTDVDSYVKRQKSNLDGLFFESDEKLKSVEMREEKLVEQEGKLKKREDTLDKNTKIMHNTLEESIKAIEKREQNVTNLEKGLKKWNAEQNDELDTKRKKIKDDQEKITQEWETIKKTVEELRTEEQRLQEWQKLMNKTRGFNKFSLPCPQCEKPMLFDANKQEIYQKINQTFGNYTHPECKSKSEQQEHVILRPVSISGEPVVRSGFSPIILSGGEPMVTMSGLEPVVQSRFPSVTQSGEETKIVESSNGTMIQSGYSPINYFGTKNLDKTSKKTGTVSS